jgi:parvulin-like peptidyl-prolyl isomerase
MLGHGDFVGAEEPGGHGNVHDVMVTVDGEPVTRGDILRRVRDAKGDIDPSKMDPDTWKRIVQTATKSEIIDKLFLKAARSENMEIDPEKLDASVDRAREILGIQNATEEGFRERVKEKMLVEKYKARLIKDITVDDEEATKYYEENKDTLTRPDRVHLELLAMDKSVDADALLQRAKQGEDFEKIALEDGNNEPSSLERRFSWTTFSAMPESVGPRLKEGKAGDILGPFLISRKYYILKILEKRQAGKAGFDEVEDRIKERVKREKETMTILSWYEARVRDHHIEYMTE